MDAAPRRKRDIVADRLLAMLDPWPERDRDRLVRVLADLARLALGGRKRKRNRR